jgi:transposase
MINADTMEHAAGLEIGTERICNDAWEKLQLSKLLRKQGWSTDDIQLACTQIISRATYPASELETARWIQENSAVCTLSGYDKESVTKDKLYQSALRLYDAKNAIELHLSERTNDLFDLRDRIILYDLTNTNFEGEKRSSALARFGRSKEKRSDARLVVLALVDNIEGFIKYSSVLQGNITDCKTLSATIYKLAVHTIGHQAVVVLDAGYNYR